MRKSDERDAAEMLRRLLDAIDRGELTADTPADRRNLRRLEGMLGAMVTEVKGPSRLRPRRRPSSAARA